MVRAPFRWRVTDSMVEDRPVWTPSADALTPAAGIRQDDPQLNSAPDETDPPVRRPGVRERAESVRSRADELLMRSAALVDRSRALRQRLGRPDWSDVPVLNVEDHEPARFLRTRILENAGYTVREAESAAEAVAASMAEPQVRLVLLDVGLPDGDGFEVCQHIKSQRADVPVVMISSIYRSAAARRQGLEMGADDYLLEPLPGHRLIGVIDRLLMDAPARLGSAMVTTDAFGTILSLNPIASRLLNLSMRGALGRSLLLFVGAERDRVARGLQLAASGQIVQEEMTLVPRERKRIRVEVDLNGSDQPNSAVVEWKIQPL
jgi:DNA-binding response OmpR family regulator